jgi:hypothetical protein
LADINQSLLDLFVQSGTRPNKYRVYLDLPVQSGADGLLDSIKNKAISSILDVVCKATSFPAIKLKQTDFMYRGKRYPLKGDISFDNVWDVTFYSDDVSLTRDIFENWIRGMDNHFEKENFMDASLVGPDVGDLSYTSTMKVSQYHYTNPIIEIAQYEFYNVFPMGISAIPLADDAKGISEFVVNFSFSHYKKLSILES